MNNRVARKSRSNITFCSQLSIGKVRIQVLEASDLHLQKQFETTLREKFAGGFAHDSIELSIQHKGVPFLNLEISRIGLSYVNCPAENISINSREG